jgi:hypothetical protein
MSTVAAHVAGHAAHPADIRVEPALTQRNRLTVGFRLLLALPHLLLVGAPATAAWLWTETTDGVTRYDWSAGGGVLGAVAAVAAIIGWFAILFAGKYPEGLRSLATLYLRWRVRATAYIALLRDEYPPFGEEAYPASLELAPSPADRNRLTVALRPILIIPHAIAIWALGIAWGFATVIAWFAILFTGNYPPGLYRFAVGAFRWTTRVEAYLLLMHDDYPPFSLE